MKKWFVAYFSSADSWADTYKDVMGFANRHELKPGEIIVLGEGKRAVNVPLGIMYYAKKELD